VTSILSAAEAAERVRADAPVTENGRGPQTWGETPAAQRRVESRLRNEGTSDRTMPLHREGT